MCQLDGEINGDGIILHPISLQSGDKAFKLDADTHTVMKRTNIKQDKCRTEEKKKQKQKTGTQRVIELVIFDKRN